MPSTISIPVMTPSWAPTRLTAFAARCSIASVLRIGYRAGSVPISSACKPRWRTRRKNSTACNVTEQEIALELGVSVEEYRETLASLPVTRVVSIEETERDGQNRAEMISDPESELASVVLEREQFLEFLATAIQRLDSDEQAVLSLYYQEGMGPQEIAQIMNLPVKRVYQLKAQSIVRLRASMQRRTMRGTHAGPHPGSHAGPQAK